MKIGVKGNLPLLFAVKLTRWCTPGMGVNLWGESPLYMNPVPSSDDGDESTSRRQRLRLAVASQEGVIARWCLKEAGVQSYEQSLPRT